MASLPTCISKCLLKLAWQKLGFSNLAKDMPSEKSCHLQEFLIFGLPKHKIVGSAVNLLRWLLIPFAGRSSPPPVISARRCAVDRSTRFTVVVVTAIGYDMIERTAATRPHDGTIR